MICLNVFQEVEGFPEIGISIFCYRLFNKLFFITVNYVLSDKQNPHKNTICPLKESLNIFSPFEIIYINSIDKLDI